MDLTLYDALLDAFDERQAREDARGSGVPVVSLGGTRKKRRQTKASREASEALWRDPIAEELAEAEAFFRSTRERPETYIEPEVVAVMRRPTYEERAAEERLIDRIAARIVAEEEAARLAAPPAPAAIPGAIGPVAPPGVVTAKVDEWGRPIQAARTRAKPSRRLVKKSAEAKSAAEAVKGTVRPKTKWDMHVAKTRAKHPELSFSDVLRMASSTYKK